jgi:hypothetical protein
MGQGSKILFLIVSINRQCPRTLLGINLTYKTRFRDFQLTLPRRKTVDISEYLFAGLLFKPSDLLLEFSV